MHEIQPLLLTTSVFHAKSFSFVAATTPSVSECVEVDGMSSPAIVPLSSITVDAPGDKNGLRPTSATPFTTDQTPTVTITLPESVEVGKIDLEPNNVDSNIDTFSVKIKDTGDLTWKPLTINGETVSSYKVLTVRRQRMSSIQKIF